MRRALIIGLTAIVLVAVLWTWFTLSWSYSDGERAREVVTEHRAIMEELEKLYEAWETALCEAETTGGCED